jgi:hypothetical protein
VINVNAQCRQALCSHVLNAQSLNSQPYFIVRAGVLGKAQRIRRDSPSETLRKRATSSGTPMLIVLNQA